MPDLFENPMGLMGFEFVEFASPTPGVPPCSRLQTAENAHHLIGTDAHATVAGRRPVHRLEQGSARDRGNQRRPGYRDG